jgi:hypothetical protein
MSRASGLCQTADGRKYYFVYNGTTDVCYPRLYEDENFFDVASWGYEENQNFCSCKEKNHIPCILSSSYGKWGFLFVSEMCEACLRITGRTHLNDYSFDRPGL